MGRKIDLSALADEPTLPDADAKAPAFAGTPLAVPVERVAANPLNTRDVHRRPAQIAELAKSIAEAGQLQPCAVVTRDAFLRIFDEFAGQPDIAAARYVQVSGGRRRAAIIHGHLQRIEIVVKDEIAESRARFADATAAENLDRENYDPIEEARAIERLVIEHGSKAAVAAARGRSAGWVSQRLNLLKLEQEVQDALRVDEDEATEDDENRPRRLPLREVRTWHELDRERQLAELAAWHRFTAVKKVDGQPSAKVPQQRPSFIQTAIKRLGGPAAMAGALLAELPPEQGRELVVALVSELAPEQRREIAEALLRQ